MEFEVVFQRQIADKMEAGFASLSDIVLKYGTEREVALFIEAAEGKLGAFFCALYSLMSLKTLSFR